MIRSDSAHSCPLTARQRRLLSILDQNGGIVPGRLLSEQLSLSTRTIRQTVSELNDTLDPEKIRIFSVPGKGYALEIHDRKTFHELVNDHLHMRSRDDRIQYLILTLLETTDWTPIADLEEALYISRTTLENDLREVRRLIVDSEPYIGLTRRQGALLFENDEQKRRDILVRIYTERWDYQSREGVAYREGYLDPDIIEGIRVELRRVLAETGIPLDDYGHIYLLLSCAVLYERNLKGCLLENVQGNAGTHETKKAADLLLARLSSIWEIETSEEDSVWLAESFARLRVLAFSGSDTTGETALAGRCVRLLHETYGLDFGDDPFFTEELSRQILAFRNHHISFQAANRYELEVLARHYEFLRLPVIALTEILQEETGYILREAESLYLLPLLASAVERRERKMRYRLRTVVVSHLNSLMTGYLGENLRKLFGTRIEIAAVLPVYDRQAIEAYQPALIITTVRQHEFRVNGIPHVMTSAVVTEEDLLRIDACIQSLERRIL